MAKEQERGIPEPPLPPLELKIPKYSKTLIARKIFDENFYGRELNLNRNK